MLDCIMQTENHALQHDSVFLSGVNIILSRLDLSHSVTRERERFIINAQSTYWHVQVTFSSLLCTQTHGHSSFLPLPAAPASTAHGQQSHMRQLVIDCHPQVWHTSATPQSLPLHEPQTRLCQGDNFRNVSGDDQPATSWGTHSTQCQLPSHGKLHGFTVWKREEERCLIWLRDITVRKKGLSAVAKLVNAWKVILPKEKTWQRCNAGFSTWYDYGEPQSSQAQRKTVILTGH